MKYSALILLLFLFVHETYGEDMRAVSRKAKAEYENALAEARKTKDKIMQDKKALKKEVSRIETIVNQLKKDIGALEKKQKQLQEKEKTLMRTQSDEDLKMRELAGTARVVARDLESILSQSLFTAFDTQRIEKIKPIINKDHFPGIDDMKSISTLFFQEMTLSGEVALRKGFYVDRSGSEKEGDILTIGKFTAAYQDEEETNFLTYADGIHQLIALSGKPPWSIRHNLSQYMQGKVDDVSFDFSGGAALRQITNKPSLISRIKKGGPIVWPILFVGFIALMIIIERGIFLKKVYVKSNPILKTVTKLVNEGKWQECEALLNDAKKRPIFNLLLSGLKGKKEDKDIIESILQEAILKEIPRLERFLPTLNVLGAIAPLLGLLGTVTGMISTFHVITLYGAGDPRLMAGGISEALVTTMLGLTIAIPIMLLHTILRRRVDRIIDDLEEKAVALVNILLLNQNEKITASP